MCKWINQVLSVNGSGTVCESSVWGALIGPAFDPVNWMHLGGASLSVSGCRAWASGWWARPLRRCGGFKMAEALTTQEQLVRVSLRIFSSSPHHVPCEHMSHSVAPLPGDFFHIFYPGGCSWKRCGLVNSTGPFAPSWDYWLRCDWQQLACVLAWWRLLVEVGIT